MKVKAYDKSIHKNSKNSAGRRFGGWRGLCMSAMVLVFGMSCAVNAFALTYQDEVDVQFTFNSTVALQISGDLVINDLAPGSSSDSNIITVTAGSNNNNGYTLYTNVGNSSNDYTDLRISSDDSGNVFNALSSPATSLNAFDNSKWGYSYCDATVSASNCNAITNWVYGSVGSTAVGYNALPLYDDNSHATDIALADTNSASETTLKFKIGAKADSAQASGTYTNVVNFIGVPKVVTINYTINYDGNGATSGVPAQQTGTATTDKAVVTLSDTIPVKDDLKFLGWCDDVATADSGCSGGTITQPGHIYALNTSATSVTKTMYAMWESTAPGLCTDEVTCMQTLATCPTTATTVTDARDGKQYKIQQLEDGNCWMLDNLALDITTVSLDDLKGNTNAGDTYLEYLKGERTGTTSDQFPTAPVSKNWTSSYSYSAPMIAVDYGTSGVCNNAYCVNDPSSGQWQSTSVTQETINGVTSIAQGPIGVYYNYCAASAGSYCWGNGTSSTGSPSSDPVPGSLRDIEADVCPAGWRLPTSSSSGEFQNLYAKYSSVYTTFQTALSTPLSGSFYSGKAYNQGDLGYFWSSTWYTTNSMYYLYVNSSNVYPSANSSRSSGNSIRCVLDS